jgi:hypothetical protein
MSTVEVSVAETPPGPGAPPAEPERVTVDASDEPLDEAAEIEQLNKELTGEIKKHHANMIAEAKGETPPDEPAPPADEKPPEAPPDEEPPADEPAPTLSKARRRMARAKQKEVAAEQLMSQIQGKAELLEQRLQEVSAATELFARDPVAGFDAIIQASKADEDQVFRALAERRLSEGTPAERAKAKPAPTDEPAWATQLRQEWAEMRKAQEADKTAAQEAQRTSWLQQDIATCHTEWQRDPKAHPYLSAEPENERNGILRSAIGNIHTAAAALAKNPNDPEHKWAMHFLTPDRDEEDKITRTPAQKVLAFLDDEARKRYTHRHEQLSQLLPAAPADASGSQGATSAGESSSAASGAKGERKLGGANVAANASARGKMSDEEEKAALELYLTGKTDKLPGK